MPYWMHCDFFGVDAGIITLHTCRSHGVDAPVHFLRGLNISGREMLENRIRSHVVGESAVVVGVAGRGGRYFRRLWCGKEFGVALGGRMVKPCARMVRVLLRGGPSGRAGMRPW